MLNVVQVLLLLFGLVGCLGNSDESTHSTLRLVTGTENRDFAELFSTFEKDNGIKLEITYQGSVDTMLDLQAGAADYDAVWPASAIWLDMGNTNHVVTNARSVMTTPVVFGVKKSVAANLGWIGKDVTVQEILDAAEQGQIRYMTSSATQSNSGAMAYLGYLYAFAGQPQVLTQADLARPDVIAKTKQILGLVDRTAGASGYLRDLFVQQYDEFDGMVNNESAIINANLKLVAEGKEPLYVIYPVDGLAIADWPLGYVDHGDPKKAEAFTTFQDYLLTDSTQHVFLDNGRRVGLGMSSTGASATVFNPDWGIDLERPIQPITIPAPDVIESALVLYQTALRKPSYTVYCLDFSGSMKGAGEKQLKEAMRTLLDQTVAARYFLQTAGDDVTVVLPFSEQVLRQWEITGNDPANLNTLLTNIEQFKTDRGTNIYACAEQALSILSTVNQNIYAPAVILMTDGRSNAGKFEQLQTTLESIPATIPVYGILFGDAEAGQVQQIADATTGRVFDGRNDLIAAFRQAKGNN